MKPLRIILSGCLLVSCLLSRGLAQGEASEKVLAGPELVVGKCLKAPNIDGVLDDPAWTESARCEFVDSKTGKAPLEKTDAWAAHDGDRIYLAFKCYERHMDKIVAIQTDRNVPEIWKDDCIEVFLAPPIEPPPPTEPFFHLLVNSNGAYYAGSPYSGVDWRPDIKVRARRLADCWTVEISIAFQSMNARAPLPQDSWSVNLNREQKTHGTNLLSGWSPTGETFHAPQFFGSFRFGEKPLLEGNCSLAGVVKHEDKPVERARVVLGKCIALTDAEGQFVIEHLPKGRHTLHVTKEGFNPTTGTVIVEERKQVVKEPLALAKAAPYAFDFPVKPLSAEKGYQIYFNHVNSPMKPRLRPSEALTAENKRMTLNTAATLGSFEPVTFTVFTNEDLAGCEVLVGDMASAEEPSAVLETDLADVRAVEVWIPPVSLGGGGEYRPEILRPLTTVDIPAKTFRQFWITWHIPEGTRGGLYKGNITFQPRNKEKTVLHLEMTIFPFALENPKNKRYGVFYQGGHGTSWLFNMDKQQKHYQADFIDMRSHGVDGLTFPERPAFKTVGDEVVTDYTAVESVLDSLKAMGWNDIKLIMFLSPISYDISEVSGISLQDAQKLNLSAKHIDILREAISGINKRVAERGLADPYYMWLDEITMYGEETVNAWVKMGKLFREISGGGKSIVTLEDAAPKKYWDVIAPYLDAAICASTDHVGELKKLYPSVGEWITYGGQGPRSGAFKANRVDQGLTFYFSPVSEMWMWTYQSIVKDQDKGGAQYVWFTATVPAEDGSPLPTLQWEGYREGCKDLAYLVTLEDEIARCESRNEKREEVRRAKELLKSLTYELRLIGTGQQKNGHIRGLYLMQLDDERFDKMRGDIGNMISDLRE